MIISSSRFAYVAATIMLLCAVVMLNGGCGKDGDDDPYDFQKMNTRVKAVAFLEQEADCNCNKDKYDQAWRVMQMTVGQLPAIKVTRMDFEKEREASATYINQKDFDMLPAVYFLDEDGKVISLLQGWLTMEQVVAVLKS